MASSAQEMELPPGPEPEIPRSLLLKPTDAARILGVGRQFMYDLIQAGPMNGGVPSIRMSRKILVPYQGLVDWVAKRMQEASDDA